MNPDPRHPPRNHLFFKNKDSDTSGESEEEENIDDNVHNANGDFVVEKISPGKSDLF